MKPWLSASFPGATSSPESKRPCRISPHPLFDVREAPLRTTETVEDPGPHHLLRHERAVRPAPNARPGGLLQGSCATARTWGRRDRSHVDVAPEPASRRRYGPEEYVDSVRLRLGCTGPCEPVPCAACQNGSLDTGAAHATCCAVGDATRGHNAVTTMVHAAAQSCDCTAGMGALSANPSRANANLPLPMSSVRNSTPASPWKKGNAALGKFGLAGHLRPFRTLWTLNPSSCLWPSALSLLCWPALCAVSSVVLIRDPFEACAHVCSQPFCTLGFEPCHVPGRVPPHFGSSVVLPGGLCCAWCPVFLEAPLESVVPILSTGPAPLAHLRTRSRSRSRLHKAAPSCPRGSILVNQRGPNGLSVKSSPVAPPDRSVSYPRHSCSSVSGPVESKSRARRQVWRLKTCLAT